MRKPKKRNYVSPFPTSYKVGGIKPDLIDGEPMPEASRGTPNSLHRQQTTKSQTDALEQILVWGHDNAFPLRLAKAVQESPATTSCLGAVNSFIKGSKFSIPDLMKIKVNKTGQTLWQLHCELSYQLSLFEGFSVNLKYNELLRITNAYLMPFESMRLVKPVDDNQQEITHVKSNPYFGTAEYKKEFTKEYPLFSPDMLKDQISELGTNFPGQVYYYGKTKPTFPFYPNPDYWAAKRWIYIDGKIQEAHAKNMDNGFFQSCLMTIVGNPDDWSEDPHQMVEIEGDDGIKRLRATKTVGEVFNEHMSKTFSGSDKMGNVFVRWVQNKDDSIDIDSFPNNTNADLFLALQDLTTKNITIATRTPGILANISEGVSLGSGGSEIQKAIELMQSNTAPERQILQDFYNDVLLPNLDKKLNGKAITDRVEIVNYQPVTVQVTIEDKFWQVMTTEEKRDFIRKNIPAVTLAAAPAVDPNVPATTEPQVNDAFRNLKGSQFQQLQRVVRDFNKDRITYEQAKQQLKGFGMTDEQADVWLITKEEEDAVPNTLVVSK